MPSRRASSSEYSAMAEKDQRRRVVDALAALDAVSVENPAYPGTPDVNFIEGWVELKWLRSWPVREETPVKLDHFRPEQRAWLRRRHRLGGNVWLLLQCRREWLLFDGTTAATHVGHVTRQDLIHLAHRYWDAGLNQLELQRCLVAGPPRFQKPNDI